MPVPAELLSSQTLCAAPENSLVYACSASTAVDALRTCTWFGVT